MKLGVKPSKLAVLDFPSFKQFITYLLDRYQTMGALGFVSATSLPRGDNNLELKGMR